MKKIFVYLVAIILVAAVSGGLWVVFNNFKTEKSSTGKVSDGAVSARTIEDLAKKAIKNDNSNTYVVGIDDTLVPASFKNAKGDYDGFDVELLTAMAKTAGKELQFKVIQYANMEKDLRNGTVDFILNAYIVDDRKSYADFSAQYLEDGPVVVVRRSSTLTSEKDLADMVVGYPQGTQLETLAKNYKNKDGLGFGSFKGYKYGTTAMVDMLQGNLNAVVIEGIVAKYYSSNSPGKFRIMDNVFPRYRVAMVMKKGNVNVKMTLDKALKTARDNGSYQKIYDKWFGKSGN